MLSPKRNEIEDGNNSCGSINTESTVNADDSNESNSRTSLTIEFCNDAATTSLNSSSSGLEYGYSNLSFNNDFVETRASEPEKYDEQEPGAKTNEPTMPILKHDFNGIFLNCTLAQDNIQNKSEMLSNYLLSKDEIEPIQMNSVTLVSSIIDNNSEPLTTALNTKCADGQKFSPAAAAGRNCKRCKFPDYYSSSSDDENFDIKKNCFNFS